MQDRHLDRKRYFEEQNYTTEKYVIPFIETVKSIDKNISVLEIGCGEGGNLMPFVKMGCQKVVGIDISEVKIEKAEVFFEDYIANNNREIVFIADDIYNIDHNRIGRFDLILMRDVMEHIHNQEKFMKMVKKFLKPGGKLFVGFPPWYNPFGGHQQVCNSKVLSKLPYFHILPIPVYRSILKVFGETKAKIDGLLEVKETGITIERFEKILRHKNYYVDKKEFYLINPNYEIKFNMKPRKIHKFLAGIPFFRNFIITAVYYLVSVNEEST